MTLANTMYAWNRGEEKKDKPKVVYVLKETGKECLVDFVSSDRQASSFGWPNKAYLGEVFENSCVSMDCWIKMTQQERDSWLARAQRAK